MEKFTLEYKSFILTEPNMLLSDWVIALVCGVCFFRLRHVRSTALPHYYRLVFIMNGIGAFLGGLSHLFYYYTGQPLKVFAWIFIGIGTYYLQRIAIDFVRKPASGKALKIFSIIKLALFIVALLYFQNFVAVLADLALGLFLIVVPMHTGHYLRTRNKGSGLILMAVGIILLSALFPLFKISVHETWFTFNDIGHICMAVSLYLIYLSANYLMDHPATVPAHEQTL